MNSSIQTIDQPNPTFLKKRKFWLKTFGCQMNYHDSERVTSYLSELNFDPTENREEADLILFNTCAIRDLSNQKFYSQLGEVKTYKQQNKDVKIGIMGCVAQMEGRQLIKKYPYLDFAFGTDVIDSVNDFVFRLYSGESKFSVNSWDKSADYSIETKRVPGTPQAFVNIIKGCDKFCSYCIVPFTRGREKSRTIKEIKEDVLKLVEYQGVQEVTLLGQNVNSFGKERGETLAQLIAELDGIPSLELIRYTTSHPYDVSDDLIQIHGSAKKLAPHLHLPVQSGSDSVLKRMLREYTVCHYLSLVDKLRAVNPGIVLSTDIIAGFPNETLEEHQATLDLLQKANFDFIYAYAFSPRAGTKASRMEDTLTKEERGRRLREIQLLQKDLQTVSRQNLIKQKLKVLVDGRDESKATWSGKSTCSRTIHFKEAQAIPSNLMWKWVEVEIEKVTSYSCQGTLIRVLR